MSIKKTSICNEIIFCMQEIAKFLHDKPEHALEELQEIASEIDKKIPFGEGHSRRVSEYALEIGKQLGFSDQQLVYLETAALLHDFGKIGMDLKMLEKSGPLTEVEKRAVEEHVLRGYYILSIFPEFEVPLKGIIAHHERFDGNGYPYRLSGQNIPLMGRIIAIADAYDAITSKRPYRDKRTPAEAMEELKRQSGKQFDPDIVDISIEVLRRNGI